MRRYNQWAGNPKGNIEDKEQCIVEVFGNFLSYQCMRKRGYGPNDEYCKQHAKMIAEGRYLNIPKDKQCPEK